jgi:hypothetical protein
VISIYHVLVDRIQVQHKRGRHAKLRLVSVHTTVSAGATCMNPVPKPCVFLALALNDLLSDRLVMIRTTHAVVTKIDGVEMTTGVGMIHI